MKINRNLLISLAIAVILILALIFSQLKSDQTTKSDSQSSQSEQTQVATQDQETAQETPAISSEPSQSAVVTNQSKLDPKNIWTYDCEIPVQLPDSITLTCGDGGWYIYQIKWSSWTPTGAKAKAVFSEKICEPSCADGYRVEAPVTLTISTFAKPGKKIFLTNLDMRASSDQNFTSGDRTLTWDLGEFAKMMDEE